MRLRSPRFGGSGSCSNNYPKKGRLRFLYARNPVYARGVILGTLDYTYICQNPGKESQADSGMEGLGFLDKLML